MSGHLIKASIAKGSFGNELESPQLTMDSVDSDPECSHPQQHTSMAASALHNAFVVEEPDEHDVGTFTAPSHHSSSTCSNRSHAETSSSKAGDQVLEMTSRLDLSDNSAILRQLNKQQQQGEDSMLSFTSVVERSVKESSAAGASGRYKSTSTLRGSTQRISALKSSSRRQLSRRPSMHETHDSEPLRRGEFLYYLYSFAILGTSVRVFMGRLFGEDCENPGEINDFLSPFAEQICVTASGTTIQRGGALFTDLPANMLGCFIMGLISSLDPVGGRPGSKLPWLDKDHQLQTHEGIHHAIKVGFCGCLTTFSSWNSQMILMMDGTNTELGSQVVPALFGYVIGMATATWCFVLGGRVHEWAYDWTNRIKDVDEDQKDGAEKPSIHSLNHNDDDDDIEQPTSWDSEDSNVKSRHSSSTGDGTTLTRQRDNGDRQARSASQQPLRNPRLTTCTTISHKVLPFLIATILLVAYGLGFGIYNLDYYRQLFASSILTPVGAHLRWKLATLNGRGIGPNHKFEWVPWGTLTGNLLAVIISASFGALQMKHHTTGLEDNAYIIALMVGIKVGLAGSLSTVSSFVKEIVNLATIHPTHAKAYVYAATTIVVAMFLGLAVYSPIMRYG